MRVLLLVLALVPLARTARAQDVPLMSAAEVAQACAGAREGENDRLFSLVLDSGWRFGALETELGADGSVASSFVPIDTRRNLRAFRGAVEAMPAGLETIGFIATEARASELEAARAGGARLRVGFFLGFDEPRRSACLVRGSRSVSLVRMDVAFVELVEPDGRVVAREDTDRFTAWSDDRDRATLPGSGPRAAVGEVTASFRVPASWQSALATSEVSRALGLCHASGVTRGADPQATARVRLSVERGGRVAESTVELANVGDTDELRCIERALSAVTLPAGPPELPARVELMVPIRLAY